MGELVVNGQAVPDSNFASLFRSVFSRTHDLEQPGIIQFLGALRQIGVHSKELSSRAVQEVYGSPLPPNGNAAARLTAFRGRVPAGPGGGGDNDDGEEEERPKWDDDADRFVTPVVQRQRPLAAAAAASPLAHSAKSAASTFEYKPLQLAAKGITSSSSSVSSPAPAAASATARSSSSSKQKQKNKEGTGKVGVGEIQQAPGKRPKILYIY